MKKLTIVLLSLGIAAVIVLYALRPVKPLAESYPATQFLVAFEADLGRNDSKAFLQKVALPATLRDRTQQEQAEFVAKAFRDEISPAGITALMSQGQHGPLRLIFPGEAEKWASVAGVRVDDCMAYRAEKNGIHAELVIATNGSSWKIVRLNNVKQME